MAEAATEGFCAEVWAASEREREAAKTPPDWPSQAEQCGDYPSRHRDVKLLQEYASQKRWDRVFNDDNTGGNVLIQHTTSFKP